MKTSTTKSVGEVLRLSNGAMMECQAASNCLEAQTTSLSHSDFDSFRRTYNAVDLIRWAQNPETATRCMVTTKSPTIGALAVKYSHDVAVFWLVSVLSNINGYLQLDESRKMTKEQLSMMAVSWISEYPRLKCSEVWVFLLKLFAGRYGQLVYGSFNPMAIGVALSQYLKERDILVWEKQKEDEKRKTEDEKIQFFVQLNQLRELRQSAKWVTLSEAEQAKISAYLKIYESTGKK